MCLILWFTRVFFFFKNNHPKKENLNLATRIKMGQTKFSTVDEAKQHATQLVREPGTKKCPEFDFVYLLVD